MEILTLTKTWQCFGCVSIVSTQKLLTNLYVSPFLSELRRWLMMLWVFGFVCFPKNCEVFAKGMAACSLGIDTGCNCKGFDWFAGLYGIGRRFLNGKKIC